MRPVLASLTAALLLAGCSGEEPGSSPAAEADSTGGRPQIAVTSTCYGECAFTAPLGLPTVAVYADGRVVAVDRTGADNRPVLRRGQLDRETLARLQALAIAARAVDGGRSTIARKSPFADGGGLTFTVRLRSTLTTVEVPLLDDEPESDAWTDPERVTAFSELEKAMREAADLADDAVTAASYVVRAQPVGGAAAGATPWPGPALATLPQLGGGLVCAVVSGAERDVVADAVDADGFGGTYTSGGRTWRVVGRVLLPHEQNCADVSETADAATASGPRHPDDERT